MILTENLESSLVTQNQNICRGLIYDSDHFKALWTVYKQLASFKTGWPNLIHYVHPGLL